MKDIYLEDDQILLRKIAEEDDEQSFNLLYQRYGREIYTNSFYLLKDHAKAEDVVQEVFVNFWIHRRKLQINNLKAYLNAAARNRVLRIFENEKRFTSFKQLISNTVSLSEAESADFLILKQEFLQAYKNLLDSLPSQRRKVFDYYFDEGLSTEDIANQLSLSRKTVQNQLGNAVSFLKASLSHLSTLLIFFF